MADELFVQICREIRPLQTGFMQTDPWLIWAYVTIVLLFKGKRRKMAHFC